MSSQNKPWSMVGAFSKIIVFSRHPLFLLLFYTPIVFSGDVTSEPIIEHIGPSSVQVKWEALGQTCYAVADVDPYMGENIPLLRVSLDTGNEDFVEDMQNCYYRGTMANENFSAIANTNSYFDFCNKDVPYRLDFSNSVRALTCTIFMEDSKRRQFHVVEVSMI